MSKSYEQGKLDGLALYGRVCTQHGSCEGCLVNEVKGSDVSCQAFMAKLPSKMLSCLTDMDSEDYTFYNEYITRFPNCNLSLDELADIVCRKAVFEGYVSCDSDKCKECWSERYITDVTEFGDEDEED